jgi:uncharacterized protein (DUF1684 family)
MKVNRLLTAIILLVSITVRAQTKDSTIISSIQKFQADLNAEFANREESPLTEEDFATFTGLPFYPIDTAFYIVARFERAVDAQPFEMKTTTARRPVYEVYGTATFIIKGETFQLQIFQNHKLRETEEYRDYLFLPFTDLTSGNGSYPGGRFIDLKIPVGDTIIIDFNKAYNPLCAYNHKYSCPIPPPENFLNVAITAGVKYH